MHLVISQRKKLVAKGTEIKGNKTLPVVKGKENNVQVESADSIKLAIKNGEKKIIKPVLKLDKRS